MGIFRLKRHPEQSLQDRITAERRAVFTAQPAPPDVPSSPRPHSPSSCCPLATPNFGFTPLPCSLITFSSLNWLCTQPGVAFLSFSLCLLTSYSSFRLLLKRRFGKAFPDCPSRLGVSRLHCATYIFPNHDGGSYLS